jgi:uncharacterized protein YjaG (DUF416 family)
LKNLTRLGEFKSMITAGYFETKIRFKMHRELDYRKLSTLEKELEDCSPYQRLAFGASMCERLLPNYSAFVRNRKGDTSRVRSALDEVWKILLNQQVDAIKVEQLIEICEALQPEEDDEGLYIYEASMTLKGIHYLLQACLDLSSQNITKIAEVIGDILFEFIFIEKDKAHQGWHEEISFDQQLKEISKHPLVVREIAKQNQDIQRLKEVETLDREFLEWLRTSSYNNGKSLIDLS